ADERGASYSLSLVLVTPFYTLLICTIVECALMMVVKIGTVYAAYSAARSAMVWLPAEPSRPDKIQLAAVQAMTPFASSLEEHCRGVGVSGQTLATENGNYFDAYRRYPASHQSRRYAWRKREYAARATRVTIVASSQEFNAELT